MAEVEHEKDEFEVWFPQGTTAEIRGKKVRVKELTWEEFDRVAHILGELAAEVFTVRKGLHMGDLASAGIAGAARTLGTVAPDKLAEIAAIGTDVPLDALKRSAAEVVPQLVGLIVLHNKGLTRNFFTIAKAFGMGKSAEDKSAQEEDEKGVGQVKDASPVGPVEN